MKIVKESLIEGVGDRYALKRFNIPDEEDSFEEDYNISKIERNKIIPVSEKASVVVNPTTIGMIPDFSRGLIDKNGNLYIAIRNNCIHQTIIDGLSQKGLIRNVDKWYEKLPTEFVTIQKVTGNTIGLGESNDLSFYSQENIEKTYGKIFDKAKEKNPNIIFICDIMSMNEYPIVEGEMKKPQYLKRNTNEFELKYEKWKLGGYSKGYFSWNLYKNGKLVCAISNNNDDKDKVLVRHIESKEKGMATKLIFMLLDKGVKIETGKPDYNSISSRISYE